MSSVEISINPNTDDSVLFSFNRSALESDSIVSVKLRIQSCKGFMIKKQKLVFHVPFDYGISDDNVLHLAIRLSIIGIIVMKTACGRKSIFHVERNRTVAYVKEHIATKEKDLEDHLLIQDICNYNSNLIHLIVCKSAKVSTKPIDKDLKREVCIEPILFNLEIVLSPVIMNLIESALDGLEKGNPPLLSSEGSGGAYFMLDESGQEFVAVFKPIDEEHMAENNPWERYVSSNGVGLKKGTRVGEGAVREVAAYLLDHPIGGRRMPMCDELGFAGVPPTVMVRCLSDSFNHPKGIDPDFKIGSMQMFVKNLATCEDMGPRSFPVEEVHKITVLDLRLANADRHSGNILYCKEGDEGRITLVPIDHGYCFPDNFEDCTFDWLYWPQSRIPYNAETIEYIRSLDAEEDIEILRFNGWDLSPLCARILRICTMLLKKGADRGLSPYEIGIILCQQTIDKEPEIENMIRKANETILPDVGEAAFLKSISEIMDSYLDELAAGSNNDI